MAEYYEISRSEMADCLESKGFELVEKTGAKELVYQWDHPKAEGKGIRVYTSIAYGRARDVGADAIRCVYWATDLDRPFAKTKRIHRVVNWERNLTVRLRIMAGVLSKMGPVDCPDCGAPMHHKLKKGSFDFFGCLCFPECKGTRETDEVLNYLDGIEEAVREHLKREGKLSA